MDHPLATPDRRAGPPVAPDVCPYLLAADRGWRSSTPARDHRCTAVAPMAVLTPEKQRRLCLATDHRTCATYLVATGDGAARVRGVSARAPLRPYARTAPVVLDRGRTTLSMPALRPGRGPGQVALVGLMSVALVAILFSRIPDLGVNGGSEPGAGGAPTATASSNDDAEPVGAPAASDAPALTLVPTEVEPTSPPEPTAAPTTPPPDASAEARTYKVKPGDTLYGIAAEFGITWQELARFNGIDDRRRLKVGQVLQIP